MNDKETLNYVLAFEIFTLVQCIIKKYSFI